MFNKTPFKMLAEMKPIRHKDGVRGSGDYRDSNRDSRGDKERLSRDIDRRGGNGTGAVAGAVVPIDVIDK